MTRVHHAQHLAYPPPRRGSIISVGIVAISLTAVTIALLIPREDRTSAPPVADRLVWADAATLHIYDLDTQRTLVIEPLQPRAQAARFLQVADDELRWFETSPDLAVLRAVRLGALERGEPTVRTVGEIAGWVQAAGSSVDGRIGVLVADEQQQRVEIWGRPNALLRPDPERRVIWEFPRYLGRGIHPGDTVRIAWSPSGANLLVVNTYVDTADHRADDTLLVLRPNGSVTRVLTGTHAAWIAQGRFLYQRYVDDGRWWIHDLDTAHEEPLAISIPLATNLAVAPDAARVALERFDEDETVVFDLSGGAPQRVEGANPIWFDADTLLTAEMAPCDQVAAEACPDRRLAATGRIRIIDLDDPDGPIRFVHDLPGTGPVRAPNHEILAILGDERG